MGKERPVASDQLAELDKVIKKVKRETKASEKAKAERGGKLKTESVAEKKSEKGADNKLGSEQANKEFKNKPKDKEISSEEIKKSENVSPEMEKDMNDLVIGEQELAQLKKELEDIVSINPEEMMFKGLSTERDRRNLHESMSKKARKSFDKKAKEVEKLKERINARKELDEKKGKLEEYKTGLESASMSAKPMESAYYEDLIESTGRDIKNLNKKVKGGFWKKFYSFISGK